MSPFATVIAGWAAVYAYVGMYYGLLHVLRRDEPEYPRFAVLSIATAVYAGGHAALVQADTVAEAAYASHAWSLGALVAIPCYVELCHVLSGRWGWERPVAYGWSLAGLVGLARGHLFDLGRPAPAATWGFAGAPDYPEPALTAWGAVLLALGWALACVAALRLVRLSREDPHVRMFLVASALTVLASANDVLIQAAGLRSVYLVEHAALLVIAAMVYRLLERVLRTSQELSRRTQELVASNAELRRTQRKLVYKEQLAAVGELSAVIAHEVRNPLAVIKNAISGLRRPSLRPDDRTTLFDILEEEADRLSRLVRDLLAYARPVTPDQRPVDLSKLIEATLEASGLGPQTDGTVDVDIDLDGAPEKLHGDPDLLRQALANVVDNALQALPRGGGKLTVRAFADADRPDTVILDFEDTGEGMEPHVLTKARNPFFSTRPSGTGLGLAIVDRVVRNHGGQIDIHSRPGAGTRVRIQLPSDLSQDDLIFVPGGPA